MGDNFHESAFEHDLVFLGHFYHCIHPLDRHLSKMHKAQVHMFTGSFWCLGPNAQNGASEKWNTECQGHHSCSGAYKEMSHMIHGRHVDFVFHDMPGSTSHNTVSGSVGRGRKYYDCRGRHPQPRNFSLTESLFMAMMSEIKCDPTHHRNDDEVKCHPRQTASYAE